MTLSDELFEKMLVSIYASELLPGAVVNEAALAERFGVSRGPVREAVRRLQGIRLVSREPYMKAFVVSLSDAEILGLAKYVMAFDKSHKAPAAKKPAAKPATN